MDDLVVNCVPIGILGQVWYLIVSIPDLCNLITLIVLFVRINGRQSYRTFRIILVGDQLDGIKAI